MLFFLASLMMAFHSLVLVFFGEFLGGIMRMDAILLRF